MTTHYTNEDIAHAMYYSESSFVALLSDRLLLRTMITSDKGAALISHNEQILKQIVDDIHAEVSNDIGSIIVVLGEDNGSTEITKEELVRHMLGDADTTDYILNNFIYVGLKESTYDTLIQLFARYFIEEEKECISFLTIVMDIFPSIRRFILTLEDVELTLPDAETRILMTKSKEELVKMIVKYKHQDKQSE